MAKGNKTTHGIGTDQGGVVSRMREGAMLYQRYAVQKILYGPARTPRSFEGVRHRFLHAGCDRLQPVLLFDNRRSGVLRHAYMLGRSLP